MSIQQHFFSGALSGLTSVLCLQPFDLLKTRIQQNEGSKGANTKLIDIVRTIVKTDGILGLWRGTSPTLMRNVPGIAMYLSGLQQLRAAMTKSPYFRLASSQSRDISKSTTLPKLTNQGNLLAGALTRVTVGVILNPISVLKARYESDIHSFTSLRQAVGALVHGGHRELLRGAGASALRDGPFAGIFLVVYEKVKRDLDANSRHLDVSPTILHLSSGAAAGTFATLSTHPFDVLKTKIQVRKEIRYHSIQSAALAIWRQRGLSGFFDGASLRLTRKVLSSAIGWAVYEGVLLFIQQQKVNEF